MGAVQIAGTVTPPEDLQPAIDALTPAGRDYLQSLKVHYPDTPVHKLIAMAADYEREHGKPPA